MKLVSDPRDAGATRTQVSLCVALDEELRAEPDKIPPEPACDMSLQMFLLYVATWSLVALSPGPAVMCSMAQATRYGFRSSLAGISGIQFGNLLFFVCIALGLAALLKTA